LSTRIASAAPTRANENTVSAKSALWRVPIVVLTSMLSKSEDLTGLGRMEQRRPAFSSCDWCRALRRLGSAGTIWQVTSQSTGG